MSTDVPVTPSEAEYQMALDATSTPTLLKRLAHLTTSIKAMKAAMKPLEDEADKIEETVLPRMIQEDTPSLTVMTEWEDADGKTTIVKMKFTVSSRSFPKMDQGSLAAAQAIAKLAKRLDEEGREDEAASFRQMLTIKGSSLEPVFREWLQNDEEFPPEFDGVITPSTRFALSKTKAK